MSTTKQVVDIECETGEGPLWHTEDERLRLHDIPPECIYRYDPSTSNHAYPTGQVTAAVPGDRGVEVDT